MTHINILSATLVATALLLGGHDARAHCDSVDGPVAKAVTKALETGDVNPVLIYAPATAAEEIIEAFGASRKVRSLGADAAALADKAFMETVIRLHRAGEGAAYTGLKPAGIDYGPVIPAAERAVDGGDLAKLESALMQEIGEALRERLAALRTVQTAPSEPRTPAEVPAARARISAELGFITFAETIRQAALGNGAAHHED